ncbi:MAG TPA: hypothetical protein VE666_19695 [Mycobacterium sp.]|nr:hypothetical protein [Mycobacterium sp.]
MLPPLTVVTRQGKRRGVGTGDDRAVDGVSWLALEVACALGRVGSAAQLPLEFVEQRSRHFLLGQHRDHVEVHHQPLDAVHLDRAPQLESTRVDVAACRLADLADEVLITRHRLRFLAGLVETLVETIGDVGLQGALTDSRFAADSDTRVEPETRAPRVANAPTAVVTVCKGRLLDHCWDAATRGFARTIASWLRR